MPVAEIQERYGIVGRDAELAAALAISESGHHLLLEGPVGVGKTALAVAVCGWLGRTTLRVDGDDRYTEAKLAGWFDPPLVLERGYGPQSFSAGPLVEAMRRGAVLFINELNRMPEMVQNVLLPALDEGVIEVPHLGVVAAADGFQVIATENPDEHVATGNLSEALRDRFEHLELGYQPGEQEVRIVAAQTRSDDADLIAAAVRIVRQTRGHPLLTKGASIRAAIATVEIAEHLSRVESKSATEHLLLRRAAAAALRTRVEVRDDIPAEFDEILDLLINSALAGSQQQVAVAEIEEQNEKPAPFRRRVLSSGSSPGEVAVRLRAATSSADAWSLAASLTSGKLEHADDEVKEHAEQLAAGAVLRRAVSLVGPLRAATRLVRGPYREGGEGELDLDATLGNVLGKQWPEADDWIVERRVEQRRQVVLMVDSSGSMAGENMALAAVASAVLALKLHAGDLGLITFSDDVRIVVALGDKPPEREIVRRLLERPCRGATNVGAALASGVEQLSRGRDPRRTAVLISDGLYTVGPDPRPVAGQFSSLHVLHTLAAQDPTTQSAWIAPWRQVGRDVARRGNGRLVPVASFDELPRRMLNLADEVLR